MFEEVARGGRSNAQVLPGLERQVPAGADDSSAGGGPAPGWELARELDLSRVADLDDSGVVDAVVGLEKLASWVAGRQAMLIGALHERYDARLDEEARQRRRADAAGAVDGGEATSSELSAALCMSRRAADGRVSLAYELTHRLPGTLVELLAGRIDVARARVIADHTCHLSDEDASAVEDHVLVRAGRQTPTGLRRAVDRAALRVDPASAERRRRRERAARGVWVHPLPDGVSELTIRTTAEAAQACLEVVSNIGRHSAGPHDDRDVDARRADAAVALLLNDTQMHTPEGPATPPVQVRVTVALPTLLGLDEQPGELAGYGAITAGVARELAASEQATWRRLLTDPLSGAVLDVGSTAYRPPAGLDRHVRARDGSCRFPGCATPAHRGDLDHVTRFPDGPTAAWNLAALCRWHHRLKHQGGWQVQPTGRQSSPHSLTWVSPAGKTYVTQPDEVLALTQAS